MAMLLPLTPSWSSSAPPGPDYSWDPSPTTPKPRPGIGPCGASGPRPRPPGTLTLPNPGPLSTRPVAACEEDATVAPLSLPPRSPPGPAAALAALGPRPCGPGPRRRSAPGSRAE